MTKNKKNISIALVHDWLFCARGSERVLDTLCDMFPNADIFALFGDKKYVKELKNIQKHKTYYSFLNKLPFLKKYYRYTYFLWPLAIEQFDFDKYDLVISVSSSVAKGIITKVQTKHISYLNTPMRYAWDLSRTYFNKNNFSFWKRLVIPIFLHYIRIWDVASNERVEYMISNSKFVSDRIYKFYKRKVDKIIYPPVDISMARIGKKSDFFLFHGALEPNKGVIETVESAIKYGFPLKISGSGSFIRKIKKMIKGKKNIELLGFTSEKEKWKLLSKAKALIFPGIEDFGMVPVEALSCATPVLCLNKGGSIEVVQNNKTGIYISKCNAEAIWKGIQQINNKKWNASILIKRAKNFSKEIFVKEMYNVVGKFGF